MPRFAGLSGPWFAVVVAAAAALPASTALHPGIDADTWWHLRVGKLVHESGSVPKFDPFSRLGREQPTPWVAYSWLYELGLYGAYSAGGLTGIMAARTMLCFVSTAALLGFAARSVGANLRGAAAVGLTAVALMPFELERPWHLTIAFTVLTAATASRLRHDGFRRAAWWLPLAFVVWANVHIQFVLGWLVLGLACLFPGNTDRTRLLALTAGCVLATFVNPYHVRLLGVVWDYATQTAALRTVRELTPPDVASAYTWATFGLIGWAAVAQARRKPRDWFAITLMAFGIVLSLRMRRDLWFGALTALVALRDTAPTRRLPWVATAGVMAGVFAAMRAIQMAGLGPSTDVAARVAADYPARAAAFVRERELHGPLFNPLDWGGYLIWELPEYPVSIDGRTNLYGSERIEREMNTWAAGDGWADDPDLQSANIVIAPSQWLFTQRLVERSDEWAVAFADDTAFVFTRVRK